MTTYTKHFSTKNTPQDQPVPGKDQIQNNAGGFVFSLDHWGRLERFLILGNEGGTYYCSEKKLTIDNAKCIQTCLKDDGLRTVAKIVEISESGRAPKNDPALFALAISMSLGDVPTKQAAGLALSRVARIGTHLFQFVEMVKALRGKGNIVKRSLQEWYKTKNARDVAYQAVKYQQRNGWSHRDILRLCRPKVDGDLQEIFHWIVKGWPGVGEDPHPNEALRPIWAMEKAKKASTKEEIVRLVRDFRLVRECVPTQWLNHKEVWEALLEEMPLTAMIRNLATMTRVGLISPLSQAAKKILSDLSDKARLKKSRIHPIAVLSALKTYAQGHGEKGKNTWSPVSQVVDALDGAFYDSFDNVEPTGKRWYLGIDVSGSMWGGMMARVPGLTPGMMAGALALVTARVESSWYMAAFHTDMVPFAPSPRQRLDDFLQGMLSLPWGGTNCALPMLNALANRIPVDAFVIYTDNETWFGSPHPFQALQEYRQKMGIPAKMIVNGMTSTGFSIADPNDFGSLDVVGCDTSTPSLIADFARDHS